MKNIYKMKLHEIITINTEDNQIDIMRVPGGWLYTRYFDFVGEPELVTSIFVSFDNEFMYMDEEAIE